MNASICELEQNLEHKFTIKFNQPLGKPVNGEISKNKKSLEKMLILFAMI